MKHIAIIAGGPSEEKEVSLNSARLITENIDQELYTYRLLIMSGRELVDDESGAKIDLNDFSLTPDGGEKEFFDFALIMIHGRPAEDGKLQGYLDWMGIPYSASGVLTSALTFNKNYCKNYLRLYEIPMVDSVCISRHEPVETEVLTPLGLPVFVKPNNNGSSVAVTKVKDWAELWGALDRVWEVDDEALIEQFIDGQEFSASIMKRENEYLRFPITEIIPKKEFFDYEAKYHGASEEITPARLNAESEKKCMDLSEKLYRILGCSGVCRFDFILRGGTFYFLEANTIPGMSPSSMVPQQALARGWSLTRLVTEMIENTEPT